MPKLREFVQWASRLFSKSETREHCPRCGTPLAPMKANAVVRYYDGQYWRSEILPPETKRSDERLLRAIREYNEQAYLGRRSNA